MLRHIPKTNVESFNILYNQNEPRIFWYVFFAVKGQLVLTFDLTCYSLQAISFEVGPELQNVDDSSALERLVAYIEISAVGGSLFMEQVIGVGTIGREENLPFLDKEQTSLERDD